MKKGSKGLIFYRPFDMCRISKSTSSKKEEERSFVYLEGLFIKG